MERLPEKVGWVKGSETQHRSVTASSKRNLM